MMRHYKNTATGAEIFTECELSSVHWTEIIESAPKVKTLTPEEPNKEPVRKTGKRAKK